MKLFLTSSPCDDDAARGLGIPFVFAEANGMAEALRRSVQPGARGLMIAAWPDNHGRNDAMAADFASAFAALGRPLRSMAMLDSRRADRCGELVRESDVILLSGGHVPTQNRFFHAIRLKEALRGCDGVVMGISAGSMNCCGEVYAQPEEPGEAVDPHFRRFLEGLDLTDVMILPHYQREKDGRVDGLRLYEDLTIPDSRGRRFVAIPDFSYVSVEGRRAVLCGEGWLIEDGAQPVRISDTAL